MNLNILECFAGIGSQYRALENLKNQNIVEDLELKLFGTSEWFIDAIIGYDLIHNSNIKDIDLVNINSLKDVYSNFFENNRSFNELSKNDIIRYINENYILSKDSKTPLEHNAISSLNINKLKQLYIALKRNNNLGSITTISGNQINSELNRQNVENIDILTYSFPCQDLSNAGLGAGIARGAQTRSGLLWEIERILKELKEININKLPKFLLMENVKALISPKHKNGWDSFKKELEEIGYVNYEFVLNSKDLGIPQSRERVFCLSERIHGSKINNEDYVDNLKRSFNEMNENNLINHNNNELLKLYNEKLKKDDITLYDFLGLNNIDVYNKYKDEYKNSQPNNTPSRVKIFKESKRLNDLDYCFTITTKADRSPNPGIIWCDEESKTINHGIENFNLRNFTFTDDLCNINNDKSAYRYLTPREALRLMGFNNLDYEILIKGELLPSTIYMFAGNSIVVNKLEVLFLEIIRRLKDRDL